MLRFPAHAWGERVSEQEAPGTTTHSRTTLPPIHDVSHTSHAPRCPDTAQLQLFLSQPSDMAATSMVLRGQAGSCVSSMRCR